MNECLVLRVERLVCAKQPAGLARINACFCASCRWQADEEVLLQQVHQVVHAEEEPAQASYLRVPNWAPVQLRVLQPQVPLPVSPH